MDDAEVRPLLIFWEVLAPRDKADEHFFRVEVAGDVAEDFKGSGVSRFPVTCGAYGSPPWSWKCRIRALGKLSPIV